MLLTLAGARRYSASRGACTFCPLSEARAPARAFVFLEAWVTCFAYLDEFGHIGPYISRGDPRYKDSPVFGLAGFVLPAAEVRGFGTWFFQRKCELLKFEIERSGEHPAVWEKKGASLFTVNNVTRYRELRNFTNRLLNKIEKLSGSSSTLGSRRPRHQPSTIRTSSTRACCRGDQADRRFLRARSRDAKQLHRNSRRA